MKYFLLIGGFFGFFIVFASGVSAGNDLSDVLRNAMIGCMCGALLMRGLRMLLTHQVRQLATEQARMANEASAAVPQQ